MPLIGDISRLGGLQRNLNELARVPAATSREVSERLNPMLQQQFATGTDPYGRPWAPLRPSTLKRGRRPPPLTASGKMRRGTKAFPLPGAGVGFTVPFPGNIHQGGSVNMQARPILPRGGRLPASWGLVIRESARAQVRQRLGR